MSTLELTAPAQLSAQQSQAWLAMAQTKNNLVHDLTKAELAAQAIIASLPKDDHAAIDAALAAYRKAHTEMVELRKDFTSKIDVGIIQPLMAFEKRIDPKSNEGYKALEATSLALRKAAQEAVTKVNAINQELGFFKAHCINEFYRVAAEYRSAIRGEINRQYACWLKEQLAPDMEKLHAHYALIPVPTIKKFNPTLISYEQMQEVYLSTPKPQWGDILQEMLAESDTVFANFDSDLANAKEAIAAREQQTMQQQFEDDKKLAEETAINTLITTAEVVSIEAPRIKSTVQVTVIESEAWAKTIMAGFITNLPQLTKYIRVKSWAKLTIGQMAEYLGKLATDEGVLVNGLTYNEIEK